MDSPISIDVQIAEIKRELRMRESVYRRMVTDGRMPEEDKATKIAVMRAVLATLEGVKAANNPQGKLQV